MDLKGLTEAMIQSGAFRQIINNPVAQIGAPPRRYLGAELLPEKQVPQNEYTETAISYRTVIANSATRYSPVQKKGGTLVGSMLVALGDSDIGSELTGADYDALIRLIEQTTGQQGVIGAGVARPDMAAMRQMTNWADMTLNRPLLEFNEKQRWDAIVSASVVRTGDNGYTETVSYPNPTGHRVAAGGTWSNNSYDPYADIIAGAEFLANKGYTVSRMIASNVIRSKLANNTKIQQRVGRISVSQDVVTGTAGRATKAAMNGLFNDDGLPPMELYDLQYRTQTGSGYFLPQTVFVMIAATGRDQSIDRADLEPLMMPNTLGYTAIGRATGQNAPGRVVKVKPIDDSKPPRVEGEAWQTSIPVIQDPEGIYVITGIS